MEVQIPVVLLLFPRLNHEYNLEVNQIQQLCLYLDIHIRLDKKHLKTIYTSSWLVSELAI